MKIIILILLLPVLNVFGQNIRNIYFDTSTRLLPSANGVVILDLDNGIRATICMNSANNSNTAIVACRMMNYIISTGPGISAMAFISSKKTSLATTYFQSLNCIGTEQSLAQCPGYRFTNPVDFRCRNNNQDLSVYCLYNYSFPTQQADAVNCSNAVRFDSQNILTLNFNNNPVYFCGVLNLMGVNEAKLFCRMLCRNDAYARIVRIANSTGVSVIGGFKRLSCPVNVASLANCNNAFPYERDECMPSDTISVSCDAPDSSSNNFPTVICGRNFLTVQWNFTTNPNVRPTDVSIIYRNVPCPTATTSNDTNVLNLTVSLNECNLDAQPLPQYIGYTFYARRTYPQVNGAMVTSDQLFQVSCNVLRNETVSQGPISLNPLSISGGTNTADVLTELKIFSDNSFGTPINSVNSVAVGTTIFVRVQMIDPPANLVLVLINCQIVSSNGISIPLIINRCPVGTYNVQIIPISYSVTSFSFQTFSIPGASNLQVSCSTSKCSTNEIGCSTRC